MGVIVQVTIASPLHCPPKFTSFFMQNTFTTSPDSLKFQPIVLSQAQNLILNVTSLEIPNLIL